ncbi:hypothetical protein [Nonomuraea wenchangensis]|uniref:hypothetical protein n=1 Tax=Nonomuraea wenchangensis TaxID=568860 RepID=UPI0034290027
MRSPPEEREALESEFERPAGRLPRRMLTAALGTLGLAGLFPLRSPLVHGPSPAVALATTDACTACTCCCCPRSSPR